MSGASKARLTAGAQFGAYRVVRLLGEGAAGAVYEVVKTSLGKRMALKLLHPSLHGEGNDLLRFQREAMIAGTLEHPNVVQVFDAGECDGLRYIAMEFLEGETLEARLAREGPLPVREVADLFVPLLSALGAVHDRGIVHRDLKPGNIFLVTRRPGMVEPKLLDFGVVKDLSGIVGGDITRAHAMVGSPAYMSPEQADRPDIVDVRSDQFTMGAILWECLIGRKLFQGDTLYQVLFQVAEGPIPPPASWRHDVPAAFDAVVMRALERDPARRFASVRAMGAALLPHCSEHVRTLWHDEFAPYAPAAVPTEAVYDDDQPTKMIPTGYDSASGMRAPLSAPSTPGLAPPQVSASLVAPFAPPVPRSSSPETSRLPYSTTADASSAKGSYPGAETFRPRARAVTEVPPPRKGRWPWGFVLAVLSVSTLAAMVLAITRRPTPDPPASSVPRAAVAPPSLPPLPALPVPAPSAPAVSHHGARDASIPPVATAAPDAAVSVGRSVGHHPPTHGRRFRGPPK
jgi:serine/threonine-protein kinase